MKKLRILWGILRRTHADSIILGFILFILLSALVILLSEPEINRYTDALWYLYSVTFTVGLGDIVATTAVGKICSVLVSVYALFVTALATGVVVSFYNRCVEAHFEETKEAFINKLTRLPELSKEELREISEKAKTFK